MSIDSKIILKLILAVFPALIITTNHVEAAFKEEEKKELIDSSCAFEDMYHIHAPRAVETRKLTKEYIARIGKESSDEKILRNLAAYNNVDCLRYFLDTHLGLDIDDQSQDNGYTALMHAAEKLRKDNLLLLLNRGALPNILNKQRKDACECVKAVRTSNKKKKKKKEKEKEKEKIINLLSNYFVSGGKHSTILNPKYVKQEFATNVLRYPHMVNAWGKEASENKTDRGGKVLYLGAGFVKKFRGSLPYGASPEVALCCNVFDQANITVVDREPRAAYSLKHIKEHFSMYISSFQEAVTLHNNIVNIGWKLNGESITSIDPIYIKNKQVNSLKSLSFACADFTKYKYGNSQWDVIIATKALLPEYLKLNKEHRDKFLIDLICSIRSKGVLMIDFHSWMPFFDWTIDLEHEYISKGIDEVEKAQNWMHNSELWKEKISKYVKEEALLTYTADKTKSITLFSPTGNSIAILTDAIFVLRRNDFV